MIAGAIQEAALQVSLRGTKYIQAAAQEVLLHPNYSWIAAYDLAKQTLGRGAMIAALVEGSHVALRTGEDSMEASARALVEAMILAEAIRESRARRLVSRVARRQVARAQARA